MADEQAAEATERSTGETPPSRRLAFLIGQHDHAVIQFRARQLGGGTLCVESHTMDDLETLDNVQHISAFGPEPGEASARLEARKLVATLSATRLRSTGLPVKESFKYRGISAWWFLEIIFQEPAYLYTRRLQALRKAARMLATEAAVQLSSFDAKSLPLVPPPKVPPRPMTINRWFAAGRNRLVSTFRTEAEKLWRTWRQRAYLSRLGTCDVLAVIEHENLRRHMSVEGTVSAVLPYAEGVIERLHDELGERLTVVTKSRRAADYEDWEFLKPSLPPMVYKPLSPEFEKAVGEVYHLAAPYLRGHLTLATLREILVARLAEYDFYLAMLERTKPKVVFAYNWEGVFRPLTTAARVKNVKVVGVQQALGPYLHALDHSSSSYYSASNPQGFAIPDVFAVWGDLHRDAMISYGYPADGVVTTGYARLDKHVVAAGNAEARARICTVLGLDPDNRYMLFTGQARVLDTALLRSDNFGETLRTLTRLAREYGFQILMKPWTSDDLSLVETVARDYPDVVSIAPQNVAVGNADLLSVCDWVVGTFSSILGEATEVGSACVLLNYPESRYYFDLPHVEHYRSMMPFADRPEDLESVVRPLIENEDLRVAQVARARASMNDLFGPRDGHAAQRIADLVLREAGGDA